MEMRPLPHGYTNDTRGDGSAVSKRYQGPGAAERYATERATLSRLPAGLPVPRLLDTPDAVAGVLVMRHLRGVHGQDLIAAGHAAEVLHSCGAALRRLQQVDAGGVIAEAPDGAVLVHGDFGPNNMVFDPVTFEVTGILDWEWAHAGDPVEDLAWCEWIIRRHHPAEIGHLDRLFAGYGHRPPWPMRQAAALTKCRQMLDLVRAAEHGYRRWQENVAITQAWTE